MTKHAASNLTPLADDPSQPSYVRELLEAGRSSSVRGYDFNRGLATHLTRVESGAPMPEWAKGMQPAAAAGVIGSLAANAGKVGLFAIPVVTAAVVAAVMLASQPDATPGGVVKSVPAVAAVGESQTVASAGPNAVVLRPASTAPAAPTAQAHGQPAKHPTASAARKAAFARAASAQSVGHVPAMAPATSTRAFSTGSIHIADATPSSAPGGTTSDTDAFANAHPAAPAAPQPESRELEHAPTSGDSVAAQPQPQPADDARLEREMGMLAMAERVLRTEPERALKLARQGEAEFQGSMFTQERQQLLLLALVELGRLDEARTLAKPYLARFPHGPFSDRVRRALASGRVDR